MRRIAIFLYNRNNTCETTISIIDFAIIAFIVFLAYKQLSKYGFVEDKTKPAEEKSSKKKVIPIALLEETFQELQADIPSYYYLTLVIKIAYKHLRKVNCIGYFLMTYPDAILELLSNKES